MSLPLVFNPQLTNVNPLAVTAAGITPFDRIEVDYAVRGAATVSWDLDPHFQDPEPWVFQLQVGETDITSDATVFTNIGGPVTGVTQTTDTAARAFGKEQTVFYRVLLTTAGHPPVTYASAPAGIFGNLDFHTWHLMQEMVRKDLLRLQRLKVGVPGFLLKAKRSGVPCTRCTDPYTQDQTDGDCPVCFGQRFVGGYYKAQASIFIDMSKFSNYPHLDTSRGTTDAMLPVIEGHFVGMPTAYSFDVWCNQTSDLRYYMRKKDITAHIRGVPFSYQIEMHQAPFSDVIYQVPLL